MKLHKGTVDGKDVYFVRTDASDAAFASAEGLVFVPKLAPLAAEGLSGAAYVFENGAAGQSTVFSSEPGRDGYAPAWTVHRARWTGEQKSITWVREIQETQLAGALAIDRTAVVVNYSPPTRSNRPSVAPGGRRRMDGAPATG